MLIPYNRPFMTGNELKYISEAHALSQLAGDGKFTRKCQEWLERTIGAKRALLTHSCTGALEMAAILAGVGPGDEVILPSFTFVSTANAFVLRGATPVFVDVREDTLNLDETLVEAAITSQTRAIVPVHYAGVGCEMEALLEIARRHRLTVIEDAAQGICATHRGKPLGSLGHLAALSFHETKNIISGEGGALLINQADLVERAEIIWQKGTNRQKFLQGQVDKYTWVDIGSSFLPSELIAAFLWAQMEEATDITEARGEIWRRYHEKLETHERRGLLQRPILPASEKHNYHIYPVRIPAGKRPPLLARLRARGIWAIFHYVPLHDSPAGKRYGRVSGNLPVTERAAAEMVRLPLWIGITEKEQDEVVKALCEELELAGAPVQQSG